MWGKSKRVGISMVKLESWELAMTNALDVRASEVIDWWEDERARVVAECQTTAQAIRDRVTAELAELGKADLVKPSSQAYDKIKKQILSDLEMLSRRLQRSIDAGLVTSIQNVERSLEDEGISLTDSLPIVASGAAAIGALGLAAAATSVSTSTATIMVFIPVSTVSWPLFAAFGAGALTLSFFSPQFLEWSTDRLRAKYLGSLHGQIDAAIFGGKKGALGICPQYLTQLDNISEQRLESFS